MKWLTVSFDFDIMIYLWTELQAPVMRRSIHGVASTLTRRSVYRRLVPDGLPT